MKTTKTTFLASARRLAILSAAGAISTAPFWGAPLSAEARPRRAGVLAGNSLETLTGTITRDLAGDSFEMRTDNGRVHVVNVLRFDEPRSLEHGDRVRVTGQLRKRVFVARNLEFLRDTPNNTGSRNERVLTGIVTRDLGGDRFEMRANGGVLYIVNVRRYDEPRSLDRNDRVRVTGHLEGKIFMARNLEFLRDTPANNSPSAPVVLSTLVGTVTRDLKADRFMLRTDNGRVYLVNIGRFDEPRSLDRGDRVRITGRLENKVFMARNIEFLRDTPANRRR